MEFYVKYWQDCNNRCDFCMQINEESQRDFGKFIKPSKESIFLHNHILFDNVKNYLEKKKYDDNGKIHVTFIGRRIIS